AGERQLSLGLLVPLMSHIWAGGDGGLVAKEAVWAALAFGTGTDANGAGTISPSPPCPLHPRTCPTPCGAGSAPSISRCQLVHGCRAGIERGDEEVREAVLTAGGRMEGAQPQAGPHLPGLFYGITLGSAAPVADFSAGEKGKGEGAALGGFLTPNAAQMVGVCSQWCTVGEGQPLAPSL
uniref:Uncharacterized protein n=1 Tax=Falco tinnunculus TaxID=100819 RepID=A0A8C4UPY8_FALTI